MRYLFAITVLAAVTACTTITDSQGRKHTVIDTEAINNASPAVASAANAILPGAGMVIQGIGGLLALIGAWQRKQHA